MASKQLISPDDRVTIITEKRMSSISAIQRGLGVIEGVMLASDLKTAEALGTAVEMIDEALKEVLGDGLQTL